MDNNIYLVPKDELYHYGVKGMKWGVRRYQNPDGSLTAKGQKRYDKNVAYKEKLVNKAQRKAKKYKQRENEAVADIKDLKKNGVKSKAYKKYKEEEFDKRQREYEEKYKWTDKDGNEYTRTYHNSSQRFWDEFSDSLSANQTIESLINDRSESAAYNRKEAKRWVKNQKSLMNMSVSEVTKKRDIRRTYRGW